MTKLSTQSSLQRVRFAVLVALVLAFVCTAAILAQEHSAPAVQGAQKGSTPGLPPSQTKGAQKGAAQPLPPSETQIDQGTSGELVEASREAAGEEEKGFNQYPSVMFLAHHLGISPFVAFWISVIFNFAVIAGAIAYFMKKYLPGAFRNRTASIQRAMTEAQRSSEEARKRLGEIENRLSRLDVEISAMKQEAEQAAAAEEAKIRAAAEEDMRKVVEAADQEIAAAANVARRELKAYAAEIAVALAQQQLDIDANTDAALVRSFASQLNSNGSGAPKHGKDGQ